jgi:hypothetical protein
LRSYPPFIPQALLTAIAYLPAAMQEAGNRIRRLLPPRRLPN